ncbi:YcxB family protein [Blastopirellula retiformator]|uniref:YcxB-like C-terminal domain-containing protein n=1 Tax=Blastopirellula retiformator TaxID=2527970 RepID=A0A5C5V4E9_9BACT|nr:YcxB family protein [Blastopirellula retiformator]TWT33201.1 hypothetical protein Enr8_30260 [Blastopirellula retiformator]
MSSGAGENPFASPTVEHDGVAPTGDAILAEGTFTQRDLKATYRALVYNWRITAILATVSLVVFAGLLNPLSGRYWAVGTVVYPLFCLLPLAVVLEVLFYVKTYWRTQNAELAKEPEPQRIVLDEQGIHFQSSRMKSLLPWTRFSRLQARSRILVIVARPFGFISLPAHYFESRDAFRAAKRLIIEQLALARTAPPPEITSDEQYVDAEIPGAISCAGTLTQREFYATCWLMVRRALLINFVVIGGVFGFSLYVAVVELAANRPQNLYISVMLLIGAALSSIRWIRYYLGIRRTYRDITSRIRTRWTITDEKLSAVSETFTLNIAWDEINRVVFRDDMLLLVYQKTQGFTLPRRFFQNEEDWRQVVEWARKLH